MKPHRRRAVLPFAWPSPALELVLVEPVIAPNTGAVARLCAATGSRLHLVEPLGFQITSSRVRRAGLDYWDHVDLTRHPNLAAFQGATANRPFWLFSTAGRRSLFDARFRPGDLLIFGSETAGLPDALLESAPDRVLGIPMQPDGVRSLNLASSAAAALYEALRQIGSRAQ
jgi:tRNA (cytidine/uridine-2'-O-)-methyltransferase